MIKILYNKTFSDDGNMHGRLVIKDRYVYASLNNTSGGRDGYDAIEEIRPYSAYVMTESNGTVKIARVPHQSDYRWLDLNRLGVSIKMDLFDITQLYGNNSVIQVDTGIVCDEEKDIIVRLFQVEPANMEFEVDEEYKLEEFDSQALIVGEHPRYYLWDSYSLTANGVEFKANKKGVMLEGDNSIPLVTDGEAPLPYIEFTLQKYKGTFTGDKLQRDCDDEEVFIDTSVGVVDNKRVRLVNGKGTFKLFPFGHTGTVKIKLGRKWYEVWNDYYFLIGDGKQ